MKTKKTTSEYSSALFSLAAERGSVKDVLASLKKFIAALDADARLGQFLKSPAIPLNDKYVLIDSSGLKNELSKSFIKLLTKKKNTDILNEAVYYFETQLNKVLGFEKVLIRTATELDKKQKELLERKVESMISKKILPEYKLDVSLIAGVVVDVNNKIFDASLKNNIRMLAKTLTAK